MIEVVSIKAIFPKYHCSLSWCPDCWGRYRKSAPRSRAAIIGFHFASSSLLQSHTSDYSNIFQIFSVGWSIRVWQPSHPAKGSSSLFSKVRKNLWEQRAALSYIYWAELYFLSKKERKKWRSCLLFCHSLQCFPFLTLKHHQITIDLWGKEMLQYIKLIFKCFGNW